MTPVRYLAACVSATLIAGLATGPASAAPSTPAGPNAVGMSPNSSGVVPNLIANNEATGFSYFVQKGLTSIQSAGIIGNFDVESGMDPNSRQSGGPGRGIAQWSAGGRWDSATNDNVLWYANQHGESPTALLAQLDFTWYELTTFSSYGLAQLRAATSITSAVIAFEDRFEGCGGCATDSRISYATAAYRRYGGPPSTLGASTAAPSSTEMDYFYRASTNRLTLHPYLAGSGWQQTQDLGAPSGGLTWDPDASSWGSGHLDVAARDGHGHLVLRSFTPGTGWGPWYSYPDTSLLSSPTIVDDAVNHVTVLWLGANHTLQSKTWARATGWSAVRSVPSVSNMASGPDATTWQVGSGHIDVVYRSVSNAVMTVTYANHWSPPVLANPTHALPGTPAAIDPGSGATGTGNFSVYVTTTDGNVFHSGGNTSTGVWSGWYAIPGSPHATAAPDAGFLPSASVFVVSGSRGSLITARYSGTAWSSWQPA